MNRIKIGAASLNQTPLAWKNNFDNIIEAIEEGKKENVSILCLPELAICGYGCEDEFLSPELTKTCFSYLKKISQYTDGIVVSVGIPYWYENTVYNGAALIIDKEIVGIVGKQNLAGDGIHYENRWFNGWPPNERRTVQFDNKQIPVGDLVFNISGVKIGFEICEDAWVANRPGNKLASYGVDIILNPSASHFAFGKHITRKRFVIEGSRSFHTTYVYANMLGNQSGRVIYDGDVIIASGGDLFSVSKRFSFKTYNLTTSVIDLDINRVRHANDRNRAFGSTDYNEIFNLYKIPQCKEKIVMVDQEEELSKHEEFTYSASLSLFDYLRKSYSRGFMVSLSGGADSSAIVTLIATMIQLLLKELSIDDVKKRIPYLSDAISDDPKVFCHNILTCVYQKSKNSGLVTEKAATVLAQGVNAKFANVEIQQLVDLYTEIAGEITGREATWKKDDLAMQNIQARVRAPGIWMAANMLGYLLVSTSNRSEAAVGYATMDGDTCGGVSPIAGIDKVYLRKWLRWMEKEGLEEIGPLKELSFVNEQEPTAELRPSDKKQTDEDDLMPYEVLDFIERLAIRDKKFPMEIFDILCIEYDMVNALEIAQWVKKFFTLWCRNQWKRERYAPSFHFDDENLDPKTYCRFPILSGGFTLEIEQVLQKAEKLSGDKK